MLSVQLRPAQRDHARPRRGLAPRDWLFAVAPLVAFATLFAGSLWLRADLPVSRVFFSAESGLWPLKEVQPFDWCYYYGCLPATAVGAAGVAIGLATLVLPRWRPARKPALFLALTLGLGPGLLVNGLLKPQVARPRPFQVTEFGGTEAFAYIGRTSTSGNHSFPSGHASMGFFFMTPALLLYRTRPGIAAGVFFAGLAYGALVSAARIVQGAHFLSDVLGAALCVWSVALVVLAGRAALKWLIARWSAADADAEAIPLRYPAHAKPTMSRRRAA